MSVTPIEAGGQIEIRPHGLTLRGALADAAAGTIGGLGFGMLPCPSMLFYNLAVRPPGPSLLEWADTLGGMAFASVAIGVFLSPYTGAIGAVAGCCTSIAVRLPQFPYRFFLAIPTALFVGGLTFALAMLAKSMGSSIGFFGAPIAPVDVAFVAAGAALVGGWPQFRAFWRRSAL